MLLSLPTSATRLTHGLWVMMVELGHDARVKMLVLVTLGDGYIVQKAITPSRSLVDKTTFYTEIYVKLACANTTPLGERVTFLTTLSCEHG